MKSLRGLLIADPAVILSVLFFGTLSLCVSFFDETGRAQAALARAWARVLLWVSGVKVRVEGVEHIDPNGSYIFIANHMSYMDTPVILAHIPVQFRFLAKRGLFKIPLIGTHLGRAGHIQKKKISLLIFPEGGRSHDGNLRPFKEGGAYIAIRAGVPLIPVVLIGTREVLPFGGGIVKPGHVTLRILKPIPTSELNIKARGPVTDQLREQILNELEARQPEPQPVA
jgi:1-acyl-sn-glycerol-3-phosphate acyltransferase